MLIEIIFSWSDTIKDITEWWVIPWDVTLVHGSNPPLCHLSKFSGFRGFNLSSDLQHVTPPPPPHHFTGSILVTRTYAHTVHEYPYYTHSKITQFSTRVLNSRASMLLYTRKLKQLSNFKSTCGCIDLPLLKAILILGECRKIAVYI